MQVCGAGGLKDFKADGSSISEQVLEIIASSVDEIRRGLTQDNSDTKARQWDCQLATLCAWRWAVSTPSLSDMLTPPQARSARKLPEFNAEFFCELIRHNQWIGHIITVDIF